MASENAGLDASLKYPLFKALAHRRSRRITRGIRAIPAGSLSYTSNQNPHPLSPLEEAVLIAATGITGITLPDRPFEGADGKPILGTPSLNMIGRAAGSPDNAQATYFFLINDEGAYFLKTVAEPASLPSTPAELLRRAELSKQLIHRGRPDLPRHHFRATEHRP